MTSQNKDDKNLMIAWGTVGSMLLGCIGLASMSSGTTADGPAVALKEQNAEFAERIDNGVVAGQTKLTDSTVDSDSPASAEDSDDLTTKTDQTAVTTDEVAATTDETAAVEVDPNLSADSAASDTIASTSLDSDPLDSDPLDSDFLANDPLASDETTVELTEETTTPDASPIEEIEELAVEELAVSEPAEAISQADTEALDPLLVTPDESSESIATLEQSTTASESVVLTSGTQVEADKPSTLASTIEPLNSSRDTPEPLESATDFSPSDPAAEPAKLSSLTAETLSDSPALPEVSDVVVPQPPASPIASASVDTSATSSVDNLSGKEAQDLVETEKPESNQSSSTSSPTATKRKPFLGVGIREPSGNTVTTLYAGSTAAKLGIKLGDKITHVNGNPINNLGELVVQLKKLNVADDTSVSVMRNGSSMKLGPIPITARN